MLESGLRRLVRCLARRNVYAQFVSPRRFSCYSFSFQFPFLSTLPTFWPPLYGQSHRLFSSVSADVRDTVGALKKLLRSKSNHSKLEELLVEGVSAETLGSALSFSELVDLGTTVLDKLRDETFARLRKEPFCSQLVEAIASKAVEDKGVTTESIIRTLELRTFLPWTSAKLSTSVAHLVRTLKRCSTRAPTLEDFVIVLRAFSTIVFDDQSEKSRLADELVVDSRRYAAATQSNTHMVLLVDELARLSDRVQEFGSLALEMFAGCDHHLVSSDGLYRLMLLSRSTPEQRKLLTMVVLHRREEFTSYQLLKMADEIFRKRPGEVESVGMDLFAEFTAQPVTIESFDAYLNSAVNPELGKQFSFLQVQALNRIIEFLADEDEDALPEKLEHFFLYTMKRRFTKQLAARQQHLLLDMVENSCAELSPATLIRHLEFASKVVSATHVVKRSGRVCQEITFALRKGALRTAVPVHSSTLVPALLMALHNLRLVNHEMLSAAEEFLLSHLLPHVWLGRRKIADIVTCYMMFNHPAEQLFVVLRTHYSKAQPPSGQLSRMLEIRILWAYAVAGVPPPPFLVDTFLKLVQESAVDKLNNSVVAFFYHAAQVLLLSKDDPSWPEVPEDLRVKLLSKFKLTRTHFRSGVSNSILSSLEDSFGKNHVAIGVQLEEEWLTAAAIYDREKEEFVAWPEDVSPLDVCRSKLSSLSGVPVALVLVHRFYLIQPGNQLSGFGRVVEKLLTCRGWLVAFVLSRHHTGLLPTEFAKVCVGKMVDTAKQGTTTVTVLERN